MYMYNILVGLGSRGGRAITVGKEGIGRARNGAVVAETPPTSNTPDAETALVGTCIRVLKFEVEKLEYRLQV